MLSLLAGFAAGTLAGALGVGGGSVTIPFLIFVLGLPAARAIATNLLIVEISSLSSLLFHWRQGTLRKEGVVMGVFGALGTVLGNMAFFQLARGRLLEKVLGAVFIALAALVLVRAEGYRRAEKVHLATVGLAAGVYSGITGKGGGSLAVPALVLLFKVNTKEAIGCAAAATPLIAFSSLVPKALAGLPDVGTALSFAPGLLAGTYVGSKVMKRSKSRTLRLILASFLFLAGIKMLLG